VPPPRWIDGPAVVAGTLGTTETTAQVHPARFTAALLDEARARGATLRPGAVEGVARHARAIRGVVVDGLVLEGDAVVLAMGPWTGRLEGLALPRVHGLKGYSVTLAAADVPADARFRDYRTADGRALEPEIIPRPDGTVCVCGMADRQPLPESAEGVEVGDAAAAVTRRQACYRPVTDDGLPGLALAELITEGEAAAVDLRPFDPARLPAAAVYH